MKVVGKDFTGGGSLAPGFPAEGVAFRGKHNLGPSARGSLFRVGRRISHTPQVFDYPAEGDILGPCALGGILPRTSGERSTGAYRVIYTNFLYNTASE